MGTGIDPFLRLFCGDKPLGKPAELTFTVGIAPSDNSDNVRVIFNDPATIVWIKGKKYVAKAHNEPFDEEKGLLMCLAKASGYKHSQLKKMLANATRQEKKKKGEKQ